MSLIRQVKQRINPLLPCLFLSLLITHIQGGGGELHSTKVYGTLVTAETIKCESKVYAFVRKLDDSYGGIDPADSGPDQAKEMDMGIAEKAFFIEHEAHSHESALYGNAPDPTPEQVEEAKAKDEAYITEIHNNLNDELKRVGISYDKEKEYVVYYYKGTSWHKVVTSFKGTLEKGDQFQMHWDREIMKITCPHIIPTLNEKTGWAFNDVIKAGDNVRCGNAFWTSEKEVKALMKKEASPAR